MNTRRAPLISTLILLYIGLILLACTLSSEPAPTIVPRATSTPPPTIGYATLPPELLPQQAVTSAPRTDVRLITLLNQVEQDRLFLHINAMQNFQTRHVNSPYDVPGIGIGAAYNYIRGQFEQIRAQSQGNFVLANDHVFPVEWGGVRSEGRNIVGVIPGTETGAGILVICAHYDSISIAFDDGSAYAPGANDNGSGVAALLEMARIMSRQPQRATVMFVAFSAEEIQRAGSLAFVQDYVLAENLDVNWTINMDIIGSSTGPDGSINDREIRLFSAEPNESGSRVLARNLQFMARRHAPDMAIILQPQGDREGRYSDHLSFSDAGIPAVRFIEINEDNARNHNDRDTLDDIQALYLTRATQTILAGATALSRGIRPPGNLVLRDEGGGVRTLVWESRPEAVSYIVALRAVGATGYTESFEVADTFVRWDGFVPSRFNAVAVAAVDETGLMGPFSFEYQIVN
ncbi:MAG: M20/M25/M40 family metallo-hydrolase [bacterium]|nr:M20/M25/M40 family metallo-hydrolase [bacterium]